MKFTEKLIDKNQKAKATRNSFGEVLAELGAKNSQIVVLDADLSKSTQTQHFAKKFPDRFFNMGIAEANMIGTAAGLSLTGKIPFAASFACFLSGRFDQIRMSVAASAANVRLVGTHAGVGIGEDGHSQMGLEDLALLRSLPNMTVIQPADDWDTRNAIEWSLEHRGPVYFRLTRQNLPALVRPAGSKFQIGKWALLNPEDFAAAEISIIFSGGVSEEVIKAADLLKERGIQSAIINAPWIKPSDEEMIAKISGTKQKLIVTVEDHFTVGGLGGLVAEAMATIASPQRLLRIGVQDFGQSGTPEANMEHYGLSAQRIFARIQTALSAHRNT
jgi:transketolase